MKKTTVNPRADQAVSDIVTYATLPPQIDYTKPWAIKATTAMKYLTSLPKQGKDYLDKAAKQIEDYYTPTGNGYSVAALDAMF